MRAPLRLFRYLLPLGFFAYAAVANLAVWTGEATFDTALEGDLVRGETTARLGTLYAAELPHRSTAVGVMGAARYLAAGEGRAGVTVGEDGWLFTDEEMRDATPDEIARAAGWVAEAGDRLAAMGTDLVVIPLPAKADIHRDRGAPPAKAQAMEIQYRLFRAELAARGVPAVDTRPALQDADRPFFARDTHWTVEGAEAVAGAVARSGRVPRGGGTFLARHAPEESFTGDLVSFVTTEKIAPAIGLGDEEVSPYVAEKKNAAQGGIFAGDGPSVPTVLVGTSYSADTRWSFAAALKLALDRDVLNRAQTGRGPFRPVAELLDDPDLAESPPDRVLWEIPVRYLGPEDGLPPAPDAPDG